MGNQSRIKSAVRHINVLNLLLLTISVAMAAHILPPLLDVKVSYTPPSPKKTAESKEEKPAAVQTPSAMEYMIIADQNVFNPERKIPKEKKDEPPLPKPEFVLYGTLIADNASIAFINDQKAPNTTPGRGKRQKTLRIGNTLSGYTLSEVYPDRVVMVRGEDRIELRVLDPSHAKARETGGSPAGAAASAQQAPAAGTSQATAPLASQRPGSPGGGAPTAAASGRSARAAQRQQLMRGQGQGYVQPVQPQQ